MMNRRQLFSWFAGGAAAAAAATAARATAAAGAAPLAAKPYERSNIAVNSRDVRVSVNDVPKVVRA